MGMDSYGIRVCEQDVWAHIVLITDSGNCEVVFRMVVFRPFASEVILAKVKSSDEDGIRCTF